MESVTPEGQTPRSLFLLIFVPFLILILGGAWFVGRERIEGELSLIRSGEIGAVVTGVMRLDDELHVPLSHLRTLLKEPALARTLEDGDGAELANLFTRLVTYGGAYDKARWIDETGRERVRVNNVSGQPRAVPDSELQQLAESYYFKAAMKLKPGQVYVSPLDLNTERGQVETPRKPVLRIAAPVADGQGRPRGILVLNVAAAGMLEAFTKSLAEARDHAGLLNSEGYWLRGTQSEEEWGFMFNRKTTLAATNPAAWKTITEIPSGQAELADGLWTWSTVYPLKEEPGVDVPAIPAWLVVSHVSDDQLALMRQNAWRLAGGIGLVLVLVFGALAAWLARAVSGRTRAVVAAAKAEAEAASAKRALETLERFQLMVEASASGLLVVDAMGLITHANPALERMFGYEPGELAGKPMEVLLPEGRQPDHVAMRESFMKKPAARPMGVGRDLTGRRKDGGHFPVEISLSAFTENGRKYVDAMVVDITRRKQMETRLKQREAHLELLIASNPNGLLVVDPEGRIELANPALEQLFGYGRGELLGQPVECLVPEADRERHHDLRLQYLRDPVPRPMGAGRNLRGRRKDGTQVPIEVSLASFSQEGRVYVQATVVRSGAV